MIPAAQAWSSPPVDDVGYIASDDMLTMGDGQLRELIENMEQVRFTGLRNFEGRWRAGLRMDDTHDQVVLDYGCGTGIEALQYARAGNKVFVADIAPSNVRLAERVLSLFGYTGLGFVLGDYSPPPSAFDVVHMSGVLHHIPDPERAVAEVAGWLRDSAQLRLMVYSDRAWRDITGTEPPEDVTDDPARMSYVRRMDGVGDWADWYDAERLERRFGQWFEVSDVQYIRPDSWFLTAILVKR